MPGNATKEFRLTAPRREASKAALLPNPRVRLQCGCGVMQICHGFPKLTPTNSKSVHRQTTFEEIDWTPIRVRRWLPVKRKSKGYRRGFDFGFKIVTAIQTPISNGRMIRKSTRRLVRTKTTDRVPMTAGHDASPQFPCREIVGRANHSAPMTEPTFKQAPVHMFWLPRKYQRNAAEPSMVAAISPTNVRLIATDCDDGPFNSLCSSHRDAEFLLNITRVSGWYPERMGPGGEGLRFGQIRVSSRSVR